jgi:hypothetical protein
VLHRPDKPGGGSGVRTVAPAWLRQRLSPRPQHGNRTFTAAPSPGRGKSFSPTDEPDNGQLFDLELWRSGVRLNQAKPVPRGKGHEGHAGPVTDDHPVQAAAEGRSRMARAPARHEAGGRFAALAPWLAAVGALHSHHSADSRSRPPCPSRHIRDPGPGGVRERRAPLTGVRYPLCYLGRSRLVGLSGPPSAPLSRPPSQPLRSRRLGFR